MTKQLCQAENYPVWLQKLSKSVSLLDEGIMAVRWDTVCQQGKRECKKSQ